MNAQAFTDMLEQFYQPFWEYFYPNGTIFQQNGALAHNNNHTKDFFMEEEMLVLNGLLAHQT